MRFVSVVVFTFLLAAPCAQASGIDERVPTSDELASLQIKADLAAPKEQCFLYAELVHRMTELAGEQLRTGDAEEASASLRAVEAYAGKIHMGMANDAKRLKNAEILMRHTAFRLKSLMLGASLNDRPAMENTLKELDRVQTEMMLQVFKK